MVSKRLVETLGFLVTVLAVSSVGVLLFAQGTNLWPLVVYLDQPAPDGSTVWPRDVTGQVIAGWGYSCRTGRAIGEANPDDPSQRDGIADGELRDLSRASGRVFIDGVLVESFWYSRLPRPDVVQAVQPAMYRLPVWCTTPPPGDTGFRGHLVRPVGPGWHAIAIELADQTGVFYWQGRVFVE